MYGDLMALSVGEVAGGEARKLRQGAGKSLEDVARAVRSYGLPWSTGRVGDFESGRAGPDIRTLLVVAAALGNVIGSPVELADLFAGSGDVAITDAVTVKRAALRAMLGSQPVKLPTPKDVEVLTLAVKVPRTRKQPEWVSGVDNDVLHRVLGELRESDVRMCQRVGVEPYWGAAAMAKVWGRTFVAERDQRAGPGANAQRRGQVSRQLKAELQELIG